MKLKLAQKLSVEHSKQRFGVHRAIFKHLVKALKPYWRSTPTPAAKPKLALTERVLVCLEYWREYRTYFHSGSSWGVSRTVSLSSEDIWKSQALVCEVQEIQAR